MAKTKSKTGKKTRRGDPRVPKVPSELTDAIQARKSAVFVGAGLSVGAGYPQWSTLLHDLITLGRHERYQINARQERELKRLVSSGDKSLLVAEELRERFGRGNLRKGTC